MEALLQFAQQLARDAGQLMLSERAESSLHRDYKDGIELVTQADLKVDALICERIRQHYPDHAILSEESSPDLQRPWESPVPVWIIDPIDGTVNYAHGHIQSAVSIAYLEDGQVSMAVVYNPFTDELFHAVAGAGAYLNDEPISVSGKTDLSRALIATGFPYVKEGLEPMVDRVQAILTHCADIRRLGSAALDICWLAAGRMDGYFESVSLWDFAAARLIAGEAGAQCGHFSAIPDGMDPQFYCQDLLIATPDLFPELRQLLAAKT